MSFTWAHTHTKRQNVYLPIRKFTCSFKSISISSCNANTWKLKHIMHIVHVDVYCTQHTCTCICTYWTHQLHSLVWFGVIVQNHHGQGVCACLLAIEDEAEVASTPLHAWEVTQCRVQPAEKGKQWNITSHVQCTHKLIHTYTYMNICTYILHIHVWEGGRSALHSVSIILYCMHNHVATHMKISCEDTCIYIYMYIALWSSAILPILIELHPRCWGPLLYIGGRIHVPVPDAASTFVYSTDIRW